MRPAHVLGDKGYDSKAIRTWLRHRNTPHAIPQRADQAPEQDPPRQLRRSPALKGARTGPSPVERGRQGSKHHLISTGMAPRDTPHPRNTRATEAPAGPRPASPPSAARS
ncbi:hypothetical protein OG978_03515 [Streptomyces sp. NBC_01591]|uniref:transposase n=1 Tax=Streptomyces sp. NBC_01591 TaxID=2975888 RepID=UPI002DDABB5D|nr:transposase [Streptomyces sp. NBC_01591]WSD66531.1 hypothetical protein OG978_03515 [Streptomyces sp. NBC_01591]